MLTVESCRAVKVNVKDESISSTIEDESAGSNCVIIVKEELAPI